MKARLTTKQKNKVGKILEQVSLYEKNGYPKEAQDNINRQNKRASFFTSIFSNNKA